MHNASSDSTMPPAPVASAMESPLLQLEVKQSSAMLSHAIAGLQLSLVQVDALLSETGVLPDEATAYEDTVSTLSEVLRNLPDMQVGAEFLMSCCRGYCFPGKRMSLATSLFTLDSRLLL